MEQQRQLELKTVQREKEQLQTVIAGQTAIIGELQHQLLHVSSNNTALQRQQQELLDTVNNLVQSFSSGPVGGGHATRQRGPCTKNMFSPTLFSRLSRWSPERTRCTYFLLSHMQQAGNVFSSCFLSLADLFNASPTVVIKEAKGIMQQLLYFCSWSA